MSQNSSNKAAMDTAVVFIFIYVFFYVTGCIGLTYLYCSEIAPLAVRTQITGMSTASSWTFNFLVVEVTPSGFSSLGWKYFLVYAEINLVLLVPSTSHSSLILLWLILPLLPPFLFPPPP